MEGEVPRFDESRQGTPIGYQEFGRQALSPTSGT